MAIKHFLALDILETACEKIIKISDASVYGLGLSVDCLRLDITLPGTTQPIYITVDSQGDTLQPYFNLNLSAIDLGLNAPNTSELSSLPDGLYIITYSVSPNEIVNVTYYHLRVTKTLAAYYRLLCKLQLETCQPTAETIQRISQLRYIKMLIDAAKSKTEYCHAPIQGVDMLTYAIKLLAGFESSCCVTCNNI